MKRKYVILTICVFYTLCAGGFYSESGTAWFNGKGNQGPALNIPTLTADYYIPHLLATTSTKYSTHDWIAECALDLLFSAFPQHQFIQMLYLNIRNLKIYFLLGTEAPDTVKISGWQDVPTSIRIITRDNIPKYLHHQVTIDTSTLRLDPNRAYLADGAKICQSQAAQMLGEGDCQAAAFYLGAMCHFIADAVFFPHLRDSIGSINPSLGFDDLLKWRMHYLTSRKLKDWNYLNGLISSNGPFFNHYDARSEFLTWKPKYEDAWQATWYAAHHVYTGEAVSSWASSTERPYRPDLKVVDANWLLIDEELPIGIENLDSLKTDNIRYDYWDNIPSDGDEKYLKALQNHLNLGVYYTAGVMNYIKDGYVKCETGMEEALSQTIQNLAFEYAFLWMMAGLGNIALVIVMAQTAVSAALSGKLKILEALQITR